MIDTKEEIVRHIENTIEKHSSEWSKDSSLSNKWELHGMLSVLEQLYFDITETAYVSIA